MAKTTKEIINNIVWKACDTFRGTLDSTQYKDYILTMLFVKYLSDFYREKLELLHKKYNNNQDRIAKAIKLEKFILDDKCTFEYLLTQKESSELGQVINKVLEKIEEDNPEKLEGIFRSIDFNNENNLGNTKQRNAILKHLLEDFADEKLDLRPSMLAGEDVIGDAYEYLIAHFASDAGKKGGEFFTPSHISTLLAQLVGAKDGDRIYDPACGSGSLLIKAAKEIGNNNFALFGQEKNGQTQTLSKMNMFLHEINEADIRWSDTLRNPLHLDNDHLMKFDIVVANPPFSLDKWGRDDLENDLYRRFDYGLPPKSKGDYAFVLHMLSSLNTEGTMGVVLPHGVLFRGASEGKIRQKILDNNLLDCVIGLPANLFFGTSIPVAILVFKKNRKNTDVLFIDASKEFTKNKNQNILEDSHIDKILTTYKNRKELEKYSHLANLTEIQENDYNLNIPRFVDTFEEEVIVDIAQTKKDISKIETELAGIKKQMSSYLQELGL
ncbi:Type I restriction-modification system, DNA-methyltransferase subunit M (EC 2.1.1.72) [uncultured Gammaproteobacteria bacterium]|jgi:type I restriction enzyme M protein|nr:Type I restriction-modification system, DNA-methyltransferase subunit M (EC 2.1.1.72) [uncultured Gammaproteobacteria bacterium]CAC9960417.1 Type I restriction-modification system, DNA-methyltransferase subunit M (EC 2.1.1.72) [uncultured Gammaproteobacteria bacterium]CAC9967318.1 Type I restriction-modification system, DNA-methyltransferase subunit M (EC 2.1.1.72) [uncultured Gammaproteobacteria bacterium]